MSLGALRRITLSWAATGQCPLLLRSMSTGTGMTKDVAPVNILKTGEDPPLKPDEEYPAWLWKLVTPPASFGDLSVKMEEGGQGALDLEEGSRFLGLERRKSIAGSNKMKGKK
ncbi:hypothetical protein BSKO_04632 [Bryopsis sp. KO-2023]|nr:hypothetical protein BSKO_04632 [Bryopsis sp. KO-2023]